jgi:hypothetical protein
MNKLFPGEKSVSLQTPLQEILAKHGSQHIRASTSYFCGYRRLRDWNQHRRGGLLLCDCLNSILPCIPFIIVPVIIRYGDSNVMHPSTCPALPFAMPA